MDFKTDAFRTLYPIILNEIDGIITLTERKFMLVLAKSCDGNAKTRILQSDIASELGVTVRTVSKLVASLVKKEFIDVIPASLIDRHMYGKGNQYCILNHPAYYAINNPGMRQAPQTK